MASLSLSGEEAVIRHLLSRDSENIGLPTLLLFMVFYVPLTLIVMGLPVACGTFVPSLLLGSLLGRIIGEAAAASNDTVSVPGIYALVGAGALLGAWTRTMLAITITIVEISGDVGIILPLIVCTLIARGIANQIAHHSYTHHNFYRLLDATNGDNGFRHPNDWAPIIVESTGPDAGANGGDGVNVADPQDKESIIYKKRRRASSKTRLRSSALGPFDQVSTIEEGATADADATIAENYDDTLNEPLVVD